jgi:hypothetical protein
MFGGLPAVFALFILENVEKWERSPLIAFLFIPISDIKVASLAYKYILCQIL